jgi:leader peptidase (prepilin peptidase) / N-methyltransferase
MLILTLWFVLIGFCLGSFFNVVIYRTPLELSVVHPPSACMTCGYKLRWFDNIPVLGFLMVRGKCRQCGTTLSWQYPLVEFITGLLTGMMFLLYGTLEGDLGRFLGVSWMVIIAIPLFLVDFRHYLIPDWFSLGGLVLALGFAFFPGDMNFWQAVIAAIVSGGGLWLLVWIFSKILGKEAMGMGDIKLMAMMGAVLGIWQALFALILASFAGVLFYLPWRLLNKDQEGEGDVLIPFGPFLLIGAIAMGFAGTQLKGFYFGILGF